LALLLLLLLLLYNGINLIMFDGNSFIINVRKFDSWLKLKM